MTRVESNENVPSSSTGFQPDNGTGKSLPPSLTTRIFDTVRGIIPKWLEHPFQEKERGLLLLERQIQRRFLNDYRAQVRAVEPILRERGRMIGEAIKSSFTGRQKNTTTYEDAYKSAAVGTFFLDSPQTREILLAVDPLISPVLTPFVEGVQEPINAIIRDVENDIRKALICTAAVSLVTGVLVGRLSKV